MDVTFKKNIDSGGCIRTIFKNLKVALHLFISRVKFLALLKAKIPPGTPTLLKG